MLFKRQNFLFIIPLILYAYCLWQWRCFKELGKGETLFMTIKYIKSAPGNSSERTIQAVYGQIKQDFGALVEPFTLHSSLPNLLAGVWMACRETEIVGQVSREIKEAVALTVSRVNNCPYCVDAHSIMLNATGNNSVAFAIAQGHVDSIEGSEFSSIIKWSLATADPDSPILRDLPFSVEEAPEIIGTAVFYHYINRMVSVFLGETPLPLNFQWSKGILKWMAGLFFSRSVGRPKSPGISLKFLPESSLPSDLEWAKHNQNVSEAFSRFAAVIEEIGEQFLCENIRLRIQGAFQGWRGEDPGLSRQWVESAIRGLDKEQQAIGRIALLTAFSPYQVDQDVIKDYYEYHPDSEKLLGIIAWSSFTISRKIGAWLYGAIQ